MLKAALPAEPLATAVDAATTFDQHCHLTITDDGITIHGTNKAREGWVQVTLTTDAFDDFHLDDAIEAAVNLEDFQRFQRLASRTDTVHLRFNDDDSSAALQANNLTYNFEPVVANSVPKIPSRYPPHRPVAIQFPGDTLRIPVRLSEDLTARVTIEDQHDGDILSITARGDDDSLEYTIHREPTDQGQLPNIEAVLAQDMVTSIYEAIPEETSVRMALGERGPIVAQFSFAGGEGLARYRLEQIA